MEIDAALVKKLKDEHYEAVSIRHELEADLVAAFKEINQLKEEVTGLKNELDVDIDLNRHIEDIYEALSSKRYPELFKLLSDLIYEKIGRVI